MNRSCIGGLAALFLMTGCGNEQDGQDPSDELAQEQTVPVNPNGGAVLGQGYNSITESYELQCVTGPVVAMPTEPAVFALEQGMSEQQTNSTLGIKVSAEATYGLVNVTARSDFQRDVQSSATSMTLVYAAWIPKLGAKLDENQLTVLREPTAHYLECGDRVVQQKILGGSLHFLAKFDFANEHDKQTFAASAGGSYSGFKLNAEMNSLRERFEKRAHITVKAIQTGGHKEQLAQVFAGASDGVASLDCDIMDLDACRQFLVNATNYANGDFAQAINEGAWEDLNYITTDWAELGLRPDRAHVPQEVVDARSALLEASKVQARIQSRIDLLKRGFFGGPEEFRNTVAELDTVLHANIEFIRRSVPRCYDELSSPPTGEEIAACAEIGQIVANPGSNPGFAAIDETQLQVPRRVSERDGRTDFVTEVTPGAGLYGEWPEHFTMCPEGMFAIGLSLKVEEQQGKGDDTALNSARLVCQNYETGDTETVELAKGLYGKWHPPARCDSGPLSGIMIRLEASQGSGDDSGANDLKGLCVSGERLEQPVSDDGAGGGAPGGARWGTWGGVAAGDGAGYEAALAASQCPPGTAVCGARGRFEGSVAGGDDTAMNGIEIACCSW